MAQMSIKIEDELKEQAGTIFNELGMNMAVAFHDTDRNL
jgi:antitoxin component of RelBE/YafQ-DinJ toxin-antitoxin module